MIIKKPQSDRSGGDQFKGGSLEGYAWPARQTFSAQPFQLGCGPHPEHTIAQIQLTRKAEYAGPARVRNLLNAATELPRPTPEQRTVRLSQHLWSIESRAVVEHSTRGRLKCPSRTLGDQIAQQVSHAGQLIDARGPAPQRDQQHPLAVNPNNIRTLPDVG